MTIFTPTVFDQRWPIFSIFQTDWNHNLVQCIHHTSTYFCNILSCQCRFGEHVRYAMKLRVIPVIPVRSIGERRQSALDQLHAALQEVEHWVVFSSMLCQVWFCTKGLVKIRGTLRLETKDDWICWRFWIFREFASRFMFRSWMWESYWTKG